MIIHNLNLVGMSIAPAKANAPLIVDADAVASLSSAFQGFQAVARRHGHLPQFRGGVQGQELAPGNALDIRRKPAGQFGPEKASGFGAGETLNHA
jgi:hypothetical protein